MKTLFCCTTAFLLVFAEGVSEDPVSSTSTNTAAAGMLLKKLEQ